MSSIHTMSTKGVEYVINRAGQKVKLRLDKITDRIERLSEGLNVSPEMITMETVGGLMTGITTSEIDELTARNAAGHIIDDTDYDTLAVRIVVDNMHLNTPATFSEAAAMLADAYPTAKISPSMYSDFILPNAAILDGLIVAQRDYDYDYFGLETLKKAYLLRIDGKIVETPQYMHMRLAVAFWADITTDSSSNSPSLLNIAQIYHMLSRRQATHATPTIFNAGTSRQSLSSCFLLTCGDSMDDIGGLIGDCLLISKWSGGIGVNVSHLRAAGSRIAGTGGVAKGILGPAKILNQVALYADQGGGRRNGSIALYMEPWHADIETFLSLRSNNTHNDLCARDLFYALFVNDLFMERVRDNGVWSLFCPTEATALLATHGQEFAAAYIALETAKKYRRQISARSLMTQIVTSQIQTGMPYMLNKDMCNACSNQSNVGTIGCSNLCAEIIEYSSPTSTAVCNLASVNLTACLVEQKGGLLVFDHTVLAKTVAALVRNMNRIIDINHYPTEKAESNNMALRPMGIGVQGLANVFMRLNMAYGDTESRVLNAEIAETIYYAAVEQSSLLCIDGESEPYDRWEGSPLAAGRFHFELMAAAVASSGKKGTCPPLSGRHDWEKLRTQVVASGVRNSLFVALMPTATTAQIMGNVESFEPLASNIYTRRTLAGEFQVVSKELIARLKGLNLWNRSMNDRIVKANGSIAAISEIPEHVRRVFRTAYEIPIKDYIDMAADRQYFVDQSQSFNLFIPKDNADARIYQALMYGWSRGLKTMSYYIRIGFAAQTLEIRTGTGTGSSSSSSSSSSVPSLAAQASVEQKEDKATAEAQMCVRGAGCDSCGA